MPVTRRSRNSGGPAAKGSQKTISFANKVTKPTPPSSKEKSLSSTLPKTLDVGHATSEAAILDQAAVELSRVKTNQSPEEAKAEKVTDAQIKKYWKEREKERRTPRVHQEGLTVEEKVLRLFDMSSQFGVCYIFPRFMGSRQLT